MSTIRSSTPARRRSRRLAAITAGAAGLVALAAVPSLADPAPTATDVVGVGSDAVQYVGDFAADGDYQGHAGYNTAGNINRLVSFDAVGDGNGRSSYLSGTSNALNPTIVLRAGSSPITRPNGGNAGVTALLADSTHLIDYVRVPAPPTAAQETTAEGAAGVGALRTVKIATDVLTVAAASTTNAPAGLSAYDLAKIYHGDYLHWSDIPGNSGGSTATIIPFTLPSTATTWKNFVADLTATGVATFTATGGGILNPNVVAVEQNDPTVLSGTNAPNELLPIYKGRLSLYAAGYFHTPNASNPLPIGATITPAVQQLTGTPPEGGGAVSYATTTGYYIIFRSSDAALTTPWQPGGLKNWAQELFVFKGTSKPFFASSAAQSDITAAGATPLYQDLGDGYHS